MPDASTFLTAVVVGAVSVQLVRIAHHTARNDRSEYRNVLARLRWWMLPAALAHLTVVVTAYAALAQIPGLSWGWYTWLTGTPSNALVGQTNQPGLGFTIGSVAIPLLLVVLVPRLALAEEQIFRTGSPHWTPTRRLTRAVRFGLVHCLVGVPLAAGLALTLSGLYYTWVYRRAHRHAWDLPDNPLPHRHAWDLPDNPLPHRHLHLSAHPAHVGAYTAAAAHTVTNWIVLSVVLLGLGLGFVYD